MIDTIKDMSILTTIPEKTLRKFYRKVAFCICEGVHEGVLSDDVSISSFDIGIGTLYIKHDNAANIKYHFEPNDILAKGVAQTVMNNENPLEPMLADALSKKFKEVYKDLC